MSADHFEILAASLRADTRDMSLFADVLAEKLERALPNATVVERKGFLGPKKVRQIQIDLGDERFRLVVDGGRLQGSRAKVVRGIVLKNETLPLDEWIDEVSRALAAEAQTSEGARLALERLLGV